MSAPAVIFDHVSKRFRLGERYTSIRDLVPALVRRAVGRGEAPGRVREQEFWAVQDVSFEVAKGEALGIIGPNGAGKSTTLKLLTRILKPTRGHCEVRGRVGALIEIAAGFHPDLTGRENIYLQGAIMGMRRAEITEHLDEIIEFAGVSKFIDTQVKRYSSGMNARLGFAIAAHLDPDVLIIDEVLSVGDMAFQRKCIERMEWFKSQGVSIVFVSHNLQAVASLCDRALYLHGSAQALGASDDVISKYIEACGDAIEPGHDVKIPITGVQLLQNGEAVKTTVPGAPLTVRATFAPTIDAPDVTLGFIVYRSSDQLVVFWGHFEVGELGGGAFRAGEPVVVDFDFNAHLTRGHYHVELHVYDNPTQRFFSRLRPAVNFVVHENRTWSGVADLGVAVSRARDCEPAATPAEQLGLAGSQR
jgi:lipopolysaccharide transport system ATP-binding protein